MPNRVYKIETQSKKITKDKTGEKQYLPRNIANTWKIKNIMKVERTKQPKEQGNSKKLLKDV